MVNNANVTPAGCASIVDFMFYLEIFRADAIAVDVLGNVFSDLRKNTMLRARDYPIKTRLVDHYDALGQMAADFPERNRLMILGFFYKSIIQKNKTKEVLQRELTGILALPWDE